MVMKHDEKKATNKQSGKDCSLFTIHDSHFTAFRDRRESWRDE